MHYRIYGDIARAAIIEVEADSPAELAKMLASDPVDLDTLKHSVIQEEKHFATFHADGAIFDENDAPVELP